MMKAGSTKTGEGQKYRNRRQEENKGKRQSGDSREESK